MPEMLVLLPVTVLLALALALAAVPVALIPMAVVLVPLVLVLVLGLPLGRVTAIVLRVAVRVPVAVPGLCRGLRLWRNGNRRSGRRSRGRRRRLRGWDGRALHVDGRLPGGSRPRGRSSGGRRHAAGHHGGGTERMARWRVHDGSGKRSRPHDRRGRPRVREREPRRRLLVADDEPRKLQRGDRRGPKGRGNNCDCKNPAQTLPLFCRSTLAWYRRNRPEPESVGSP